MKFRKAFSTVFFYLVMVPIYLIILFIFWYVFSDVISIFKIGFCTKGNNSILVGIVGIIIGISFILPVSALAYRMRPWFQGLVRLTYINLSLLCFSEKILNMGYSTTDASKRMLFTILTIIMIILYRLGVSFYMHKKPIIDFRGIE